MGSQEDDAYWNDKIYQKPCPNCYSEVDECEGQCDECGYMFSEEDD